MKTLLFALVASIAPLTVVSRAAVITDGDFSSFTFDQVGTSTVSREPSGGNPGARLNITTVSGNQTFGMAIKNDFVSRDVLQGATFSLSLDVLSGPGDFGDGQAIAFIVQQGGSTYYTITDVTGGTHPTFDRLTFSGGFVEDGFSLATGTGPAHPSFAGGVDTRFGFGGLNSNSGTLTQYYDNFSLSSAAITPEPSSLIAAAGGAAFLLRPRRRAHRRTMCDA